MIEQVLQHVGLFEVFFKDYLLNVHPPLVCVLSLHLIGEQTVGARNVQCIFLPIRAHFQVVEQNDVGQVHSILSVDVKSRS